MDKFKIPVVLILFKRKDTVLKIIDRIRQVQPEKIYILSDEGRNEKEKKIVDDVRRTVENALDWDCTVKKNYARENRGVHANIGLGAKWVFEQEDKAIFLEDDNLPEVTFFRYCEEMLDLYEDDERILWVCGTNYLADYNTSNGSSYMFTRHLLPCGWASWADKFNSFYDDKLLLADDSYVMSNIQNSYQDRKLYLQQCESIMNEKYRKDHGKRFGSWDYHMLLTLRANEMLGISPAKNQIKNIGVDENSIHGGSSMSNIMTKRFCGMESYPLEFPLVHPKTVLVDSDYERKISDIILYPFRYRISMKFTRAIKKLIGIPTHKKFKEGLKDKFCK